MFRSLFSMLKCNNKFEQIGSSKRAQINHNPLLCKWGSRFYFSLMYFVPLTTNAIAVLTFSHEILYPILVNYDTELNNHWF